MSQYRTAIIGGGISGLSTAWYLERKLGPEVSIDLFEAGETTGGKVQTVRTADELIVEQGPDAILCKENSAVSELIEKLGLKGDLIEPSAKEFAIQKGGRLYPVPLGMLQPYPKNLKSLWRCGLFSPLGKIAATVLPPLSALFPQSARGDRSISKAMRSRFGREVSESFYETVFGGIHSGDPDSLSFRSLYPHLDRPRPKSASGAKFISFREGCGVLPQRLEGALRSTTILRNTKVLDIQIRESGGASVHFQGGERRYDAVCVAVPSYAAAGMFQRYERLSQALQQIRHSSSAVVTMAIPASSPVRKRALGSGYLLTHSEPGVVTGCTYSSQKWSNRAPSDLFLLRIFFGRGGLAGEMTDQALLELARSEVQEKLGAMQEPVFVQCKRWENGLPQYELGHERRLRAIEDSVQELASVVLTGTSYRGIGIPDCIAQAKNAAQRVEHILQSAQGGEEIEKEEYLYDEPIRA